MPRPPLDIGTHGKVRFEKCSDGFRARTRFRDFDGVTRDVERVGLTKTAAERELKKALRDRSRSSSDELSRESKIKTVAEKWFAQLEVSVQRGKVSPSTEDTYRSILRRYIVPGVGDLRLYEATVSRLDLFLLAVSESGGIASAKTARTVLSGVLGFATRNGAIDRNPVRDTSPIAGAVVKVPRALTKAERSEWIALLEADEKAVRWGLPNLSRFMMSTGVRVGEALALYWEDVDLDAATVAIDWTVVRARGKGLIRKSTKSSAGERTLPLPSQIVAVLQRMRVDADEEGWGEDSPVFAANTGGMRDPNNTLKVIRQCRGMDQFAWVTSHVFRKTAATILDEAGLSSRVVADQLGHSKPSMTQDVYLARKVVSPEAAAALEGIFE